MCCADKAIFVRFLFGVCLLLSFFSPEVPVQGGLVRASVPGRLTPPWRISPGCRAREGLPTRALRPDDSQQPGFWVCGKKRRRRALAALVLGALAFAALALAAEWPILGRKWIRPLLCYRRQLGGAIQVARPRQCITIFQVQGPKIWGWRNMEKLPGDAKDDGVARGTKEAPLYGVKC